MLHTSVKFDLAIIGGGPSAYALAASCADKGLTVATVEPDVGARWIPNYACWADELQHPDLQSCIEATWASPLVYVQNDVIDVTRRYAKISTPRLQSLLQVRCSLKGVKHISGQVTHIAHEESHDVLHLANGRKLNATLCVDASGHRSVFTHRTSGALPGWQVAYGQLIETKEPVPFAAGEMVLMDYRIPAACNEDDRLSYHLKPSFLYAMPLSSHLLFVEETILVGRPAADFDLLKQRLALRLVSMGIKSSKVLEEEHCWIEMGGGVPLRRQRHLAFGAAAGMVHPATGYLISRMLGTAPKFAEAIAQGIESGITDAVRKSLWYSLWPTDMRRTWSLYQFGMDILCRLSHEQMSSFFHAFFQLEPHLWQGFMSASMSTSAVARAMAQFFLLADPALKAELMRSGIGSGRNHLFRSVVGA
ncbi:MAG: lycopene cyclase family protein [Myxococcota bacterium]